MRQRKYLFAVFAILLLFAACKGESPTSPTTTPPSTGGTGNTPPSGASVTLVVSNASPLVNSTSTITATVTQNGQPVANGTAVQFTTTGGTFTDVGASGASVIKTTTNGVATATLTSGSAGAMTVTATVNNVSKSTTITFKAIQPGPPPPQNTSPTVSQITPATGRPEGGETITIKGTNFREPVRVVFTCAGSATTTPDPAACMGQTSKDAFVASVTPTQITAITPAFNVPAGGALAFNVTVFVGAGTTSELSVAVPAAFVETSPSLIPVVRAVTPASGPIGGGTRVTIIGDAFQAPVQVFFAPAPINPQNPGAEAQVISVNFNQIIVMSPRASDTAPSGSGTITGPIDIRVRNVGSGTDVIFPSGFRYTPKMQITTINPSSGPMTGGTHVTIDGVGFDDPLSVSIAGVAAQATRVSGTEVVAITGQPLQSSCGNLSGPVIVTNTENGDTATGPLFTFVLPLPLVVSATGPVAPGGTTSVTVINAQGIPRILIGDQPGTITATTVNPDGTTTFTVQVPSTLVLNTKVCSGAAGVSAPTTTLFSVTYTSLTTSCTNTLANALTVTPPNTAVLFVTPPQFGTFTATITPASAGPPATPATVTASAPQTVTLANTGTAPLTITSMTATSVSGAGCANFSFTPTPSAVGGTVLNQCDVVPVTVQYNGQTTPTSDVCTLAFATNAGNKTLTLTGSSQ